MSAQQVGDALVAAFNEPDEERRREYLEQAVVEDVAFGSGSGRLIGRDAVMQAIGALHERREQTRIVCTSAVAEVAGFICFSWKIIRQDGSTVVEGLDFGDLSGDGRLKSFVSFTLPLPSLDT
jgi:hypothetical protein